MENAAKIKIALAGNPNCGKTTIFNNITGAKQHVGNYPGVTVEKKEGHRTFNGKDLLFVDLPGTYSLTARSLDEVVARNVIINENRTSSSTSSMRPTWNVTYTWPHSSSNWAAPWSSP